VAMKFVKRVVHMCFFFKNEIFNLVCFCS
jgi:hypothetical protein